MTAFDPIAAAYELLCDRGRIARELPFLSAWCGGSRAIDLACGLGDHLGELLAAGAISGGTGVDLSGAMAARAAHRHPDPRLAFVVGDLAAADLAGHQRALCLGNALNCLAGPIAAGAALRRLGEALPPGGRLLVQVVNPLRPGPDHACVVRRSEDAVVVKTVVHIAERSLLGLTLHHRGPDGWISHSEHQILLRLGAEDLAIACAGLGTCHILGGLDGSPYYPGTSTDVVLDLHRG